MEQPHPSSTYQYRTSSPHSTSKRKWEKATGRALGSRAIRNQARSSVSSSRFSRSFQPHSLCSYLQGDRGGPEAAIPEFLGGEIGGFRVRLQCLHVGFGQLEGPINRGSLQAGDAFAFDGDVEAVGGGKGLEPGGHWERTRRELETLGGLQEDRETLGWCWKKIAGTKAETGMQPVENKG